MKTRKNYLPASDIQKAFWLNNFSIKIGTHATALGISTAEVTAIKKDAAFYYYIENLVEAFKSGTNNLVAYKEMLKKADEHQHLGSLPAIPAMGTPPPLVSEGIFDRVSRLVKRIKASLNYTSAIGQDLGIIAPSSPIDISALQPILKVSMEAGKPRIRCNKKGTDGIDLYVDRHDGAGFILLGRFMITDVVDNAGLPSGLSMAKFTYKAMFVKGNENVGVMSGEVSAVKV